MIYLIAAYDWLYSNTMLAIAYIVGVYLGVTWAYVWIRLWVKILS